MLPEKLRILVIDDDPDTRETVRAILEAHGFVVETMEDGIYALSLKEGYDAILLDVQMPVFDGERLIDYWSVTQPELLDRVIMMTAYSRRPRRERSAAFASVEKPFRYDHIVQLVTECVNRPRPAASTDDPESPSG